MSADGLPLGVASSIVGVLMIVSRHWMGRFEENFWRGRRSAESSARLSFAIGCLLIAAGPVLALVIGVVDK